MCVCQKIRFHTRNRTHYLHEKSHCREMSLSGPLSFPLVQGTCRWSHWKVWCNVSADIMSTVGDVLFDRSTDNHEEIWDDTELIRAYDRAHQQIQTRLRTTPKAKKERDSRPVREKKTRQDEVPTTCSPVPIPMHLMSPPKDEQDAFHSMLMAWYMAGFHAGQLAARTRKNTTTT